MIPASEVCFRETPPNYCFSWHVAPRRQFIINLDSSVEVTTSDGNSKIFASGEIFFVEDTNGKGHFSRSLENKSRRSVFIAVPDSFPEEHSGIKRNYNPA